MSEQLTDPSFDSIETGVDRSTLIEVGKASVEFGNKVSSQPASQPIPLLLLVSLTLVVGCSLAPCFQNVHARLRRLFAEARIKALEQGTSIDFPTAEALAVGSLLRQGHNVRLSGQDVGRGTFSQRHFVITDQTSGIPFVPFDSLVPNSGRLHVINSPLSEFAVMGFGVIAECERAS